MSENKRASQPPRGPGHGHGPGAVAGDKAKDFKGTVSKFRSRLAQYKLKLILVFVMSVGSAVLAIIGPKILGRATDTLFQGFMASIAGTGSVDFGKIGSILLKLLCIYAFSALCGYLQGFVMTGVTTKLTYGLRNEIHEKIHRLPFSYYDGTSHGDVLSRVTNDVDTISQSLNQSLTQIITSVTTLIGVMVMMISISWQMTLVAVCVIPISSIFIINIVKKSQKHFISQQGSLGKVNGHIEEMFGAHVVMKAFNGEEQSKEIFSEFNDELYNAAWKAHFMSALMQPITVIIGNISYVAICVLGGYLASMGKLTVGGIQSFVQYVRSFNQPIAQIANISNVLQQTAAAAERVFEFLEEEEEVPERENALSVNRSGKPDTPTCVSTKGAVEFRNIAFGYTPEQLIIKDFSAEVAPGQKIAIVGPTGAGKTTIVKLLMRFYDVDKGAICIDGHDIRDFKRDELRSMLGMVLQDTWLFSGTVGDNIRYGKLDATDEELYAAAQAAQVDHFVRTLPGGYDMMINEEMDNISQGQKQLLTIARAILADPEILILDEATSNVDTRTEILIQKAMDNLMQGRTSFIIAHRLSTIKNADLILVMKDGDIIEQGTHRELLDKDGFYSNLYNSQFEQ